MNTFLQRLRYYFMILTDRQTPLYVKLILGVALLYILIPMDFLSDTILLFGWLDDLAVASFIVSLATRLVPREVADRVRRKLYGKPQ